MVYKTDSEIESFQQEYRQQYKDEKRPKTRKKISYPKLEKKIPGGGLNYH